MDLFEGVGRVGVVFGSSRRRGRMVGDVVEEKGSIIAVTVTSPTPMTQVSLHTLKKSEKACFLTL